MTLSEMAALRSLLFVPGDSAGKIARALASAADALILDLEDSVSPDRRTMAREQCRAVLDEGPAKPVFVRVNALNSADVLSDLAAVVRARPAGIVLPKCTGDADLERLDLYLAALEARDGIEIGSTRIMPIVTESAAAVLRVGSYRLDTPRLWGMMWGGEDLATDLGAWDNRDEAHRYRPTYELARSLCLLAAASARTFAIDAVYTDFRDLAGLRQEAEAAARDGYAAKAAIHPDQLGVINEAFTPTASQVEQARRVIHAFQAADGAAVAVLDGRMLDRPHYLAAEHVLRRAKSLDDADPG